MTDEKIIKALELCKDPMASCDECFLVNADRSCERTLMGTALDLINRQKAEIERLNRDYSTAVETMSNSIRTANAEKEALIAGQETLQKALAEKIAEIERLEEQVNLWQEEASSVGCENEWLKAWLKEKSAEIERLQTENEKLRCVIGDLSNNTEQAKAEAIKEFAERLTDKADLKAINAFESSWVISQELIDNLVKEMVGDAK